MIYDAKYFIGFFEAIPENDWTTGSFCDSEGRRCALGLCGSANGFTFQDTDRSFALHNILKNPIHINDALPGSGYVHLSTPKERILAALRDVESVGVACS